MFKRTLFIIILITAISATFLVYSTNKKNNKNNIGTLETTVEIPVSTTEIIPDKEVHPLSIEALRNRTYGGSEISIERELPAGSNYKKYLTSYKSDHLKIYSMLTVPTDTQPESGWPAIIFNHGYIPPEQYSTTQRYEAYVDGFAKNGYVVFKPDYRGHGQSEGFPEGGYYSPTYTIDILNAVTAVKKLPYVNSERIGMWGHSMGGSITLKSMVVSKDIKAGVIWAGVVGSYEDLFYNWRRRSGWTPSQRESDPRRPSRQSLTETHGEPKDNPEFWNSLSATTYINDLSGPIQLHHGTNDASVPIEFSQKLSDLIKTTDKGVELYTYEGADHNLSGNAFGLAMTRSIKFFDTYLK